MSHINSSDWWNFAVVLVTSSLVETSGLADLASTVLQVEAITILENEKSYANILLGDYAVPEAGLIHVGKKALQYLDHSKVLTVFNLQDFLRKFSRYNFADYCLGILYTNRLFTGTSRVNCAVHMYY
jgi:hypothetical protein